MPGACSRASRCRTNASPPSCPWARTRCGGAPSSNPSPHNPRTACSTSQPVQAWLPVHWSAAMAAKVIGLDQSTDMLAAGSADGRPLVRAQGERLPFADDSFDHVTFTYLLRYVDEPAATIGELTRVLRPGGRL